MNDLLDIVLKTIIPLIPAAVAFLWSRTKLIDKLDADTFLLKSQNSKMAEQVDLMRKDVYRLQLQNDRLSTDLGNVSITSVKALQAAEKVVGELSHVKVIGDEHKAVKEAYGKVILILDKLVKNKQG